MNTNMSTSSMNLCLSRDPSCCGVAPCTACYDFLVAGRIHGQMVWPAGGVLPRTMAVAGPPFNADLGTAAMFMRAFPVALSEGANFVAQLVASDLATRQVQQAQQALYRHPAPAPVEQPQHQPQSGNPQQAVRRVPTEEEHLLTFHDEMVANLPRLSEADRLKICTGVANQNLEGWEALTEGERHVLRLIFLPPVTPPEDAEAPLPSNESAAKVVAALRAGTLGPHTLLPPEVAREMAAAAGQAEGSPPAEPPPLRERDLTAAYAGAVRSQDAGPAPGPKDLGGAAVAPLQAPEGVAPQPPPVVSRDAGVNGTTTGTAQVAVPSQETTSS